jgi:hypothetical protein
MKTNLLPQGTTQLRNANPSRLAQQLLLTSLLLAGSDLAVLADCAAPPDGLVGWWRAEGDAANTQGINHGTLHGQTSYGTGIVGQCFAFDGSGDGVMVGTAASYQYQNFTLEAWIKRSSATQVNANPAADACIISRGGEGYGLGIDPTGRPFLTQLDLSAVYGPAVLTNTAWHHLAVTKSGSTVIFYVDGVASAPQTYAVTFGFANGIAIGSRGDNLASCFLGSIDEPSIYGRPLAATEVLSIYNAGASGKCYTATAPQITVQPADQTVALGDSASFAVTASGTSPLNYQWTFAGTNLSGATGTQLPLPSVADAQAGDYAVVVANTSGSVTSRTAVLTVVPTPPCTPSPAGLLGWWRAEGNAWNAVEATQGALQGQTTYAAGRVGRCFVLDGSGDGVVIGSAADYQLQDFTIEAWVKRSSATQVSAYAAGDGMIISRGGTGYGFGIGASGRPFLTKVDVSNVAGPVLLTDTTWHHLAVTKSNSTVTFYLDGAAALTTNYVVTFAFPNGVAIGARGDNLASCLLGSIDEPGIYNRPLADSEVQAIYAAGRSGKCFIGVPPQIATQPADQTAVAGDLVSFSVAATGSGPLSYQWTFEGSNLAGATGTQLQFFPVSLAQAGHYAAVVTNAFGSVTSATAMLTVSAPPPCITPPAGLVGWWRADGTTADFVSGGSGTFAGQAAYAPGKVGTGFVFDGVTDGVRVGRPAGLQLQNFTFEAWVKRASTAQVTGVASQDAVFLSYGSGGYGFGLDRFGRPMLTQLGTSAALGPSLITNTAWHHMAVTKTGPTVTFSVDGVTYPPMAIYVNGASYPVTNFPVVFTFNTDLGIGARGDNLGNSFLGSVDEPSIYARPLTTNEIADIYLAGAGGKCPVPALPLAVITPVSQTVVQGATATFTATATGTGPFGYQWAWNGTNLAGATTTSLTLTNVQASQAGNYSVTVTNPAGTVVSAPATLVVTLPPATVRIVATTAMAGVPVTVPVEIIANGNENALQFSLNFDTALLTYSGVDIGPNFADATLFVNTSQTPSGKLGIILALPTDATMIPGTQPVVVVNFNTAIGNSAVSSTISFGDAPTVRQLVDVQARTLSATYSQATVTLSPSILEGDVNPRPDGDSSVTVADWVTLGRYAARLDYPTNASEFQRADCAPRSIFGDGSIKVTDWVQAGRYAGGADPLTIVGGPVEELPPGPARRAPKDDSDRRLLLGQGAWYAGQTGVVPIVLQAQGNESALGFSVSFDPAVFAFVSAVKGTSSSAATLYVNTAQAGSGKVGIALALSSGSFPAGGREMVRVNLRALSAAPAGQLAVAFADSPVPREISDPLARSLLADYVPGTVTIQPPPALRILSSGSQVTLAWPVAATNFIVKVSASPDPANWTDAPGSPIILNGEQTLTLPATDQTRFYRLVGP